MAVMREFKATIRLKDVANIRGIAAAIPDGDTNPVVVATVLGKVSSINFHDNPNGALPSKSLGGVFEVTPADPARAVIFGERIFLPQSLVDQIAGVILKGQEKHIPAKKPDKGKVINVAGVIEVPITVEVAIRKAVTATGYEWAVTSVSKDDPKAVDPFAEQRAMLTGRPALAALPAPAASKRKRK